MDYCILSLSCHHHRIVLAIRFDLAICFDLAIRSDCNILSDLERTCCGSRESLGKLNDLVLRGCRVTSRGATLVVRFQ